MEQNTLTSHSKPEGRPGCRSTAEGRCSYYFPSGRRCRHAASPDAQYCLTHASKTEPVPVDKALTAELLEAAADFSTAADVRRVMARVFHAMLERRLSTKEAGILCYIAQTILHSHRAELYQQKLEAEAAAIAAEEDEPEKLTWNLPR